MTNIISINPDQTFSFGNVQIRVFGDHTNPLFSVADICEALQLTNPTMAIKNLAPFEKTTIRVTRQNPNINDPKLNLGVLSQEINVVNESGLFTLVLRSRDAIKEGTIAYNFRLWVTNEVLPSIRKTGKYELPRETISTEQQYLLRKAVERRCKNDSLHFQRVYHELYDRFKIPSYRDLLKSDFEEAMAFLEAEDLLPGGSDGVAPETPPKGGIYLTADETQTVANCVYLYRYLFRDRFFVIFQVLKTLNSPLSAELYEAFNNLSMIQLEHSLEKKGVKVPKPQQNLIM